MMTTTVKGVDQERIARAVREILEAIGEDPVREGLRETPRRIAEMYEELFAGLHQDPREVLTTGFQEPHREMVILKNIPFYSLCEHHFLPFHGRAHVGYVPEHLCMTMRGVQKPGTTLVTSAIRGGFRRRAVTRAEFLALVRGG